MERATTVKILTYAIAFGTAVLFITVQTATAQLSSIGTYHEKIVIDESGSARVTLSLILEGCTAPQRIPLEYSIFIDFINRTAALYEVDTARVGATRFLVVRGCRASRDTVEVEFTVPHYFDRTKLKKEAHGNYRLSRRFVQTAESEIASFERTIVLPKGFVVSSVDESIPQYTEKDSKSPFTISKIADRHALTLRAKNMKLGDVAMVSMRVKEEGKSAVLFGILMLAGLFHLIFFRDVLKEQPGDPPRPRGTNKS